MSELRWRELVARSNREQFSDQFFDSLKICIFKVNLGLFKLSKQFSMKNSIFLVDAGGGGVLRECINPYPHRCT